MKPDQPTDTAHPSRPLTRKQKAFVQYLLSHPKASGAEASRATYDVTSDLSARQQAHDVLTSPNVQAELTKYSPEAQNTLLDVMRTSTEMMHADVSRAVDWAANARMTADSLLDRVHGKAKQSIDVTSTSVNLNIDLS
jgi:hypothetical protein